MTDVDSQRPRWRVAITREEDANGPWHLALDEAGFEPVSCAVIVEGPPPDPARLADAAHDLGAFDWVICSSARSVRALVEARLSSGDEAGGRWPQGPRFAAVGPVTAAAMQAAGASPPIVTGSSGAAALWEQLRDAEQWRGKRVLIATVPGGRRELIDALRGAGANVEAIECYSMQPRTVDDIRKDWEQGRPDAVLLASPSAARAIAQAVGVPDLMALKAIVPIGVTTAAALAGVGIAADPPDATTFEAIVERLVALRESAGVK